MAGVYLVTVAISGSFLGSLVDRYKKKTVMMLSSICSLCLYMLAYIIFISTPISVFTDPSNVILWIFIILTLVGAIAGNLRTIALSTLVTILYQILVISRCLCCLWPPMKASMGTDQRRLRLEREAALRLHVLQGIQVGEVPVGQCFIG